MINYAFTQSMVLFLFLIPYVLFYRKSSEFTINRIYLWFSLTASTIIPFITFEVIRNEITTITTIKRGTINNSDMEAVITTSSSSLDVISLIYLIVSGLLLVLLSFKLLVLFKSFKKLDWKQYNGYNIAKTNGQTASFFNYILLEDEDHIKLQHEISHVRLRHSYDRVIMELACSLLWFNPFIWILKYLLVENHEFAADNFALKDAHIQKSDYCSRLINEVAKHNSFSYSVPNSYYSLIKNRLKMITNNNLINRTKYLYLLPFITLVICSFTFKSYDVYPQIQDEGLVATDTIPGSLMIVDTISVFDSETETEKVMVVKNFGDLNDHLKNINFSGKTDIFVDTIAVFDYETLDESTLILKQEVPVEITRMKNLVDSQTTYWELEKSYRKVITVSSNSDGSLFHQFNVKEDMALEIFSENEDLVTKHYLSKEEKGFKPKDIGLSKGIYTVKIISPKKYSHESIKITITK